MLRNLALATVLLGAATATASADVALGASSAPGMGGEFTIASFDPQNAVAPISSVEGPGWKVGEGTVLHPVVGLETGVVSNVFYEQNNPSAGGVMRLLAQIGAASLNQSRLNPNAALTLEGPESGDNPALRGDKGELQYQASARVAYDQMLSSKHSVSQSGGLGAGLSVRGMVNPMGTIAFGFDENFLRQIRAQNFETPDNVNRDGNSLRLTMLLQPRGRSVSGYLYYQNIIDVFENYGEIYASRMLHHVGLHPQWRWLPQTVVYGDASLGVVSGLGADAASTRKSSSMPLTLKAGISTLLSPKTSLSTQLGYGNGFYASGPSYSAPLVDVLGTYHYSPLGRVGASLGLQYTDSVNANYYRDYVARVFVQHAVSPLVLVVQPELHVRQYQGVTVPGPMVRDDLVFAMVGGAHYNFRNWLAATLDYRFSTVGTSYRYMDAQGDVVDPSYVRHDLLLGVRAAM